MFSKSGLAMCIRGLAIIAPAVIYGLNVLFKNDLFVCCGFYNCGNIPNLQDGAGGYFATVEYCGR
jgi:hypothetical protein